MDNESRQLIEERFAKLAEELQKQYSPVHQKITALQFALGTTIESMPLSGPDEVLKAATKYYEFIKGTANEKS